MMRTFKTHFSLQRMQASLILLKALDYLPSFLGGAVSNRFVENMEFVVSNTQGAREPVYFNNKIIHELNCWGPNPSQSSAFVFVNSYNLKTRFYLTFDKNCSVNAKDFSKRLERIIDAEIAKVKSN
jgi:hypothetical protein